MLLRLFYSKTLFAVTFWLLLASLVLTITWYRESEMVAYVGELLLLILVMGNFLIHRQRLQKAEQWLLFLGLLLCFGGVTLLLHGDTTTEMQMGWLGLLSAQLSLGGAFLYRAQWDIDKLLLMLTFSMLYGLTVLYFIYDLPILYFRPTCIILALSLILFKVAGFRSSTTNYYYWKVLAGVVLLVLAETMVLLRPLFPQAYWTNTTVVFLMGAATYLILSGMLEVRNLKAFYQKP